MLALHASTVSFLLHPLVPHPNSEYEHAHVASILYSLARRQIQEDFENKNLGYEAPDLHKYEVKFHKYIAHHQSVWLCIPPE